MTSSVSHVSAADDALAERARSPRRTETLSRIGFQSDSAAEAKSPLSRLAPQSDSAAGGRGSQQRVPSLPLSSPRGKDLKKIADLEKELAALRADAARHAILSDREVQIANAGVRVIIGAEHATHEIMDAQQAEHKAQQVEVAAQQQAQALHGQTLHAEQLVASQKVAVDRQQQQQAQLQQQQQQSLQHQAQVAVATVDAETTRQQQREAALRQEAERQNLVEQEQRQEQHRLEEVRKGFAQAEADRKAVEEEARRQLAQKDELLRQRAQLDQVRKDLEAERSLTLKAQIRAQEERLQLEAQQSAQASSSGALTPRTVKELIKVSVAQAVAEVAAAGVKTASQAGSSKGSRGRKKPSIQFDISTDSDDGCGDSLKGSRKGDPDSPDPSDGGGGGGGGGGGPGGDGSGGSPSLNDDVWSSYPRRRRREADRIDGMPKFPTVNAWPGWRREVMSCLAASAAVPQMSTDMILRAEKWEGKAERFIVPPEFETLDAKFFKELKKVLKDPVLSREIATLEEKTLRTQHKQLCGMAVYILVYRHFKRDERLAKPQAYEEISLCTYETSLKVFMAKWNASMERFLQAGMVNENDEAMLYALFKKQFLRAAELKDHHAKFTRSMPGSRVHSYRWMHQTCENVLEAEKLETHAKARLDGMKPGTADPVMPVVPGGEKSPKKTPADQEKKREELKNVACPRAVAGTPCKFFDEGKCFYNHSKKVVGEAKAKPKPKAKSGPSPKAKAGGEKFDKSKSICHFFAKGTCRNGDKCEYKHEAADGSKGQNPTAGVVTVVSSAERCAAVATIIQKKGGQCRKDAVSGGQCAASNHFAALKTLQDPKAILPREPPILQAYCAESAPKAILLRESDGFPKRFCRGNPIIDDGTISSIAEESDEHFVSRLPKRFCCGSPIIDEIACGPSAETRLDLKKGSCAVVVSSNVAMLQSQIDDELEAALKFHKPFAIACPAARLEKESLGKGGESAKNTYHLFAFPKQPDCEICHAARLTEAPAKRHPADHVDPRLKTDKFGDVVHLDTLFLNIGADGGLEAVDESAQAIMLQVFKDEHSSDIEAYQTPSKHWRQVRDAMIEFGGSREGILKIYSDRAPEFKKAARELGIAPLKGTPGRPTSHATGERANRTCLEWSRHGLLQSGLPLEWAALCVRHEMMHRRCQPQKDGNSIYGERHPGCKLPKLWPFGAKVIFKVPPLQEDRSKVSPPGRAGVLVGYDVQPGGAWSGDYRVADLRDFESGALRKTARVWTSKTVIWDEKITPEFPIADAKKLAQKQRLADQAGLEINHQTMRMPVIVTSDDEEAESGSEEEEEDEAEAEKAEEELEPQEEASEENPEEERKAEIPKDFINHFRLGGWFRRLPLCDPSTVRPPNTGSRRPFDVHPQVWSAIGQCPQARELVCREAEKRGEQPPELPDDVLKTLPEESRVAVTEAILRAADVEAGVVKLKPAGKSKPSAETRSVPACPAPVANSLQDPKAILPRDPPNGSQGDSATGANGETVETLDTKVWWETLPASEFKELWPEGANAKASLDEWCQREGVPGPSQNTVGHRQRVAAPQAGFGLVNKPVAANSKEWRSSSGQQALVDEKQKHEKRGTWDLKGVVELSKLLQETRRTGEEVVIGGVHPVMYEKHSEDAENATLRARVVFTAPRARTSSGLDPHSLYNEISSAPVTFQAARVCRAVGALRGFVGSTRDADSAYLQAALDRKGSPRTYVALPKSFWPEAWEGVFDKPMVPLVLALFGHPEAGNIWENHSFGKIREQKWIDAPEYPSVFKHATTKGLLTAYVDDFEMHASKAASEQHWKDLEKVIEFKDPPHYWSNEPTSHLGCRYRVTQKKTSDGHTLTTSSSEMELYLINMCEKFEEKYKLVLTKYKTPYLDAVEAKRVEAKNDPPRFGKEAASPIMAGLYAARSARPDLNVATLRLARRCTRWTCVDDAKLLRYMGYLKGSAAVSLQSQLSTCDLEDAVLRIWPDADLAGDPDEDTHSSGGSWIELASADGSRSYALHWSYAKQGFTAGHTQEAEIAAMYDSLRSDGLPLASLLEFFLERPLAVEVLEDNAAAIVAARKGYSKRLRHLHRTKRIHVGYLGEVFDEENPQAQLIKAATKDQKGDILTKEMDGKRFGECKEMLQLQNNFPITAPRALVCMNGEIVPVAAALHKIAAIAKPVAAAGVLPGKNAWVIDTGSGYHLIPRAAVDNKKHIIKSDEELTLMTANGVVTTSEKLDVKIKELGIIVECWILENTPLVLSVAGLVQDHDCEFLWWKSRPDVAELKRGGKTTFLPIVQGTPALLV